jgi:hypothetical protein
LRRALKFEEVMIMAADLRRIRAVAASLRGIRERVEEHDDVLYWNTTPFDNAIGLLDSAIEDTDFSNHAINEAEFGAIDYLVPLDSLIAFLEVYEKEAQGGGVLNFLPRQQG